MKYRLSTVLILGLLSAPVNATDDQLTPFVMHRAGADISVKIDGNLDEPIWSDRQKRGNMVVIEPDTLADPVNETETYFFYTDNGLYVGVVSHQDPDTLLARLSSRDKFIRRDGISFTLDPSGEGLYGYWFSVNLGGTLQDGTVIPERQFSNQWDGAWYGASAETDTGWTAEMFIPWSIMTMPDIDTSTRKMGYYLSRSVAELGERWSHPGLPRTRSTFMSALQPIEFENVTPKKQLTFYPYASSAYNRNAANSPDAYKSGFDIFWRPLSNLQLTATVNPDFGNVESDRVDVNLSSFESFFSEKRAFFLEGQEIFNTSPRARQQMGGGTPTSLIYTRRIGSSPRDTGIADLELPLVVKNQPSELYGAAKITGQNGNWRYGLLAAFEEDTKLDGLINGTPFQATQDGRDYAAGRFLYEDTSTGARRSVGWLTTHAAHPQYDATVHGLDTHYLSRNGKWQADAQLIASDVDDVTGQGGFVDISYTPKRGRKHSLAFDYFDDKVDINDFGFFRRNDIKGGRYKYGRTDSNIPGLQERRTNLRIVEEYNRDGQRTRSGIFANQDRVFDSNNSVFYELNYFPKRWEDRNSEGNGDYRVEGRWQTGAFFETDESRPLSVGIGAFYTGEHIGGRTLEYSVETAWRPNDRFSLIVDLGYEDKKGWVLHQSNREFGAYDAEFWRPQIEMDFFLSARQQFRITAQWAGIKADERERLDVPLSDGSLQTLNLAAGASDRDFTISRVTFQARYRWELAPLSDLFIVYTRGSDVDSMPDEDFGELLSDAWTDALIDIFVIKLRYRLGG
ncbi:MAG: hypothetical protein ACI9W1_003014 [Candidatus Azotimanducaceae bacterium]